MRIVITTGPSHEPLDRVRRLTNLSTGELGTLMAEGFADAGHSVTCFRGEGSTFAPPLWPVEVVPFTTNDDLATKLQKLANRDEVNLVFHAAALCDFRVREVRNEQNQPVAADGKIPSREGILQVTLEPAPKILAGLRRLFPAAILVGWKYEIEGASEEVQKKAREQMEECLSDACVMNGPAYGTGFGMIDRTGEQTHLPSKAALTHYLVEWSAGMPMATTTPRRESFHALASFMPLGPFV